MDISEILTSKLDAKGWSQNRLAAESGINQGQISRIVRGKRKNVELETLRAFARALDCSVVDLLPDDDKLGWSRAKVA